MAPVRPPRGCPARRDSPSVLWLGDLRAEDARLTGAKAAALATASRHGLPVVPGFVITTAASEDLAAGTPLPDAVLDAWRRLSQNSSPAAG